MAIGETIGNSWSQEDCDKAVHALEQAESLRILVVGDLMVDAYLLGKVERISPEAPVPILRASRRERRPGGAANVALNLLALGAESTVAGIIGNDTEGKDLRLAMEDLGMDTAGVMALESRRTTVKTRVMSGGQHLLRVDEEDDTDLEGEDAQQFLGQLATVLSAQSFDAILIEDYDKGALSPTVIDGLLHMAREKNIPVTVDPKFRHYDCYKGVNLFKPNLKEFRDGLGLIWEEGDTHAMKKAMEEGLALLMEQWAPEMVLLTLSEQGVRIRTRMEDVHHAAHPREILDVSGAGDTVIAVATVLLAQGVAPPTLAQVANLAGGWVCEKPGVVPVDRHALMEEIRRLPVTT
jgi:rfaE bifunctional protein kinase chain/domain